MHSKKKSTVIKEMVPNTDHHDVGPALTKFSLTSKEYFEKGWVKSFDVKEMNVDEVISAIQMSENDCYRIFKEDARDISKSSQEEYVVWRYGDSKRILASNYMNLIPKTVKAGKADAVELAIVNEMEINPDLVSYMSGMPLTDNPTFVQSPIIVREGRQLLSGANSKLTKLLDGSWATHIHKLRIITSFGIECIYYPSGQLALLICTDDNRNILNIFIYDEKTTAMLLAFSLAFGLAIYKSNGALWFYVDRAGGMYYDYNSSKLNTWLGKSPWSPSNSLELELNKYISVRFKGVFNLTITYRFAIDNLNINIVQDFPPVDVTPDDQTEKTSEVDYTEKLKKNLSTIPQFNYEDIDEVQQRIFKLNDTWKSLKQVQYEIRQIMKKIEKRLHAFFSTPPYSRYKVSQVGKLKDPYGIPYDNETIPCQELKKEVKFEHSAEQKIKESIICPLILRQQILHHQKRKKLAALHGFAFESKSSNKMWLACTCSTTEIPVVTDIEFQEYITKRSPSTQLIIVCITKSKRANPSKVQELLQEIYCAQNAKHRRPCTQLPLSSYRILYYDLNTATSGTGRSVPWLIEQHAVMQDMVMMYLRKKLYFCDFKFNGYGINQRNLLLQIQRCFELEQMGISLPNDFKFGSSFEQPNAIKFGVRELSLYSLTELYKKPISVIEENEEISDDKEK